MFAIIYRTRPRVTKGSIFIRPQFIVPQNAVLINSFCSTQKSSSDVYTDEPKRSLTVSYLVNSCGLSSKDAISVSKKMCIKTPERTDLAIELLRKYGFTNAHISRLVFRWPRALVLRPDKILPKLEFFRSIGVSDADLARALSAYPMVLQRSLEKYLIPSYDYFRSLLQSDKKVIKLFSCVPRAFGYGWKSEISFNIAILRERGVPESSILSMVTHQPWLLLVAKKKFTAFVDRAAEMGFDHSKRVFIHAIQVFVYMSESTLKRKMDAYRRSGWSDSQITAAFLRHPLCMTLSEEKIMANMDFLVNQLGYELGAVAQSPVLLGYSLEKRMKPRCLVARILKAKGLLKIPTNVTSLLTISEEKFLKRFVVGHQEDIPELLDIYQGKLSPPDMVSVEK